ncbi:glycoside hydrolase family 16 protein [Flavihumibacter petaseus]|uniref:Beta-glucanase n=1 Tax=Flavihumibacter petaseus NBRC 106054 TaxID=1220578 RepID=A0A0E9MYL6_9BACT|nr:glycoside hydrolase family 16 protein [Flavihumibacter petaseus]GAO42220.1 beta-glucanase [Flavihumibacter petaseus NBRC 106054]
MRLILMFIFCACSGMLQAQFSRLVWSEEFNYKGLPDSSKWGYDSGGHGWGNNELQYYTVRRLENARVENGMLIIEARKEAYNGGKFTSARLFSKGKGDWTFGRIEVRAKLPKGKGIWPAIWMLPTYWEYGDWPRAGEIDIMEFVGYLPDSVFGTVHTKSFNHVIGTQKGKGLLMKGLGDEFHIYGINWTNEKIQFQIDGKTYHEFANTGSGIDDWPFDKAFHLLLNVAVGGNWGGKMGVDESIFPQSMLVDYVRIYQ